MRTRNKVVIGGLTILTTAALFGSCVGAAAPPPRGAGLMLAMG